jgi:hypothetical protein
MGFGMQYRQRNIRLQVEKVGELREVVDERGRTLALRVTGCNCAGDNRRHGYLQSRHEGAGER